MSLERPVRTLNPEIARKIAAGEVIDRPNAIVRELMDNAIDSGATSITVEICAGGIEKIRIVDNGCGMTKEDLLNCARPHATSKIETETDLLNLSTLGFRGEALASIAAVARLSIISGSWKMRASITEDHIVEPVAEIKGTIVQSEGLFENFPARRQFLKRAATEGVMCKNTFIEKAMARPDIAFRFINDGETKIDLPANQSLKDRFIMANGYSENNALFYELSADSGQKEPDWSFKVIIGEPAVSRSNKKDIYIYANGRRIQEYSLTQAVEYGGQGFFPNGTYPVAAVFVQVNPKLIDFNIHPAKREARFYDISSLHHGLSSNIKAFFQNYTRSNFEEGKNTDEVRYENHISYKPTYEASRHTQTNSDISDFRSRFFGRSADGGDGLNRNISLNAGSSGVTNESSGLNPGNRFVNESDGLNPGNRFANEGSGLNPAPAPSLISQAFEAAAGKSAQPVQYIGRCLGTFLLAEKNSKLYIIDQHAVHERILFDKLMRSQGENQPLLIPYKIKTDSKTQDNQLEKLKDSLTKIGFTTQKIEDGYWEISTIPQRWTGTEYDLRTLIFVKQVEPEEIIRSIAAMTACKAAIKDGYIIDNQTAAELVNKAFELEDPHCPHGRPVYTVLSREQLFAMVKRT